MNREIPSKLYKYMKSEHTDAFFKRGKLRIGTLYDYRKDEKSNVARMDKGEGTIILYSDEDIDSEHPENISPIARDCVSVHKGQYTRFIGFRFQKTVEIPNYHILCTSEEYNLKIMSAFDCDCCVQINRPTDFFQTINGCLRQKVLVHKEYHVERCIYQDRARHWLHQSGPHPALIKDPEYEYQREVRVIWTPASYVVEPVFITCKAARKFCSIVSQC